MTLFDPFESTEVVETKECLTCTARLRLSDPEFCEKCDLHNERKNAGQYVFLKSSFPEGIFTVSFLNDAKRITIRIRKGKYGSFAGRFVASYLYGQNNDSDYKGFAHYDADKKAFKIWRSNKSDFAVEALEFLCENDNHELAGMLYAVESSRCWRCGRTLTVPASIHNGLGPECYSKVYG